MLLEMPQRTEALLGKDVEGVKNASEDRSAPRKKRSKLNYRQLPSFNLSRRACSVVKVDIFKFSR
jgi:hypothetical protein